MERLGRKLVPLRWLAVGVLVAVAPPAGAQAPASATAQLRSGQAQSAQVPSPTSAAERPMSRQATERPMSPEATERLMSPEDAAYRLAPGDRIRMSVFDEPNLSGEFTVNDNGTLSLPLIGDMPAAGRPLGGVRDAVQAKFASGYLLKPRVGMELLTRQPYFILGEVTKPGEYPFTVGLTVYKAVARAEGFTYRADRKRVWVKGTGDERERKQKLDSATPIRPGDTIRIGERYF